MKKSRKFILSAVSFIFCMLVLVACGGKIEKVTYEVESGGGNTTFEIQSRKEQVEKILIATQVSHELLNISSKTEAEAYMKETEDSFSLKNLKGVEVSFKDENKNIIMTIEMDFKKADKGTLPTISNDKNRYKNVPTVKELEKELKKLDAKKIK